MTDIQEKPTLTFEDKNYVIDDLSDTSKYIVSQLQDLQQQATASRARIDQIEMSRRGFEDLLRTELAGPIPDTEEVPEEV